MFSESKSLEIKALAGYLGPGGSYDSQDTEFFPGPNPGPGEEFRCGSLGPGPLILLIVVLGVLYEDVVEGA